MSKTLDLASNANCYICPVYNVNFEYMQQIPDSYQSLLNLHQGQVGRFSSCSLAELPKDATIFTTLYKALDFSKAFFIF